MKEMKKWQWAFVAFLVIITLASIVADFTASHDSHGSDSHAADAHKTKDTHHVEDAHKAEDAHHEADAHHGGHWWSFKTFWIWFGAIGTFVITIFAKKILGPIIYKKEDFYNE
jgi:hypothetical protein